MAGGRPTKMTAETIQKLETAFIAGCTDLEACCYADVSKSTLYDYCQNNPEFSERKETLKNQPLMQARFIIREALVDGDLNTANRVIDRKEGQKIKQDITSGGKQINTWVVSPVTTDKE
tara:strand:+ start:162 stop:518 length:357 start_codon:yes stop_codon:yes gene_type:complete